MADDQTRSGNLPAEIPAIAGAYQPVTPNEVNSTLAQNLVPVADQIRATVAHLGFMPYRVFLLHVRWTGAQAGEGQPRIISLREITPSPRIRDMNSTSFAMRSTGLAEEGDLSVDRISARFTEDDLIGMTPDLQSPLVPQTLREDVEFYWMVEESRPSTPRPQPRLYVPSSVPMLIRGGVEWRVALKKRDFNPDRYGQLLLGPFPDPQV